MEENAYIEKVTSDLKFAAQAGRDLRLNKRAFKQLIAYPQVAQKLVSDPVFFACLMCGEPTPQTIKNSYET
jgi:hypothetical protein